MVKDYQFQIIDGLTGLGRFDLSGSLNTMAV